MNIIEKDQEFSSLDKYMFIPFLLFGLLIPFATIIISHELRKESLKKAV